MLDSRVVTAHIPKAMARRLDGFADRLNRSRGWIIREALSNWIARQDAANPNLPTALDPAEKAISSLKSLREFSTLDDITWRELRDAGRS